MTEPSIKVERGNPSGILRFVTGRRAPFRYIVSATCRSMLPSLVVAMLLVVSDRAVAVEIDWKASEPVTEPEEYGRGVRTTEPRTPAGQLAGFHVPDHITVELVASEPLIAKPLNIAFDWKGRLWTTQTYEYPYPYKAENDTEKLGPRDSIVVLEDVDGDGYREKATTFADKLNIPMGILPYRDGVICFEIPNIVFLRDTDGDSVCDRREVILGPFDTTRDTHGMVNSLRWMPDGWIMANHGFNNQSKVAGRDGHEVTLSSGNVFRFKADGSRIELYAQGQVNPFGMTIDEYGDVFTADCHSKPISQVIHGGCYQSFGRPHDGLGFVPDMMDHLHGSTAIAGLELARGSNLPATFEECFLSGNVMTSRINCNYLKRSGLTASAIELPDFLTSDDSWFRPVDLRLGPDGWIYIADFYNRIIGHYEVPLTHEGRDRFRGRIWRVGEVNASSEIPNFETIRQCAYRLSDVNPTNVRLAMQRIEELIQENETNKTILRNELKGFSKLTPAILWAQSICYDKNELQSSLGHQAESESDVLASSALKLLLRSSTLQSTDELASFNKSALQNLSSFPTKPHAAQVAANILARSGTVDDAVQLLAVIKATKETDRVLHAALRIALRAMLSREEIRNDLVAGWQSNRPCAEETSTKPVAQSVPQRIDIHSDEARLLFDVLIALSPNNFPVDVGLAYLQSSKPETGIPTELLSAFAGAIPAENAIDLLCMSENLNRTNADLQLEQVSLSTKLLHDGGKLNSSARDFVAQFLTTWQANNLDESKIVSWVAGSPLPNMKQTPWPYQARDSISNGKTASIQVYSSFPLGEQYIGSFTSVPFECSTDTIEFALCGHNGRPDDVDAKRNRVELVDAVTLEALRTAYSPRNDVAQLVRWATDDLKGRLVSIRLIDEDANDSYAWIAAGGFSLPELSASTQRLRLDRLIGLLDYVDADVAKALTIPKQADAYYQMRWKTKALRPAPLAAALGAWAIEHGFFAEGIQLSQTGSENALPKDMFQSIAKKSDSATQRELASLLASQESWYSELLMSVQQGWISAGALVAMPPAWWDANAKNAVVTELATLKPNDSEVLKQKQERFVSLRDTILKSVGDVNAGRAIYTQHCSVCHQFAGQGKVVGPQLEGVGGRGTARLCEDLLMPNLNVDHAFHTTSLLTVDGQVVTGLVRERDANKLVIADSKGELQTIAVESIDEEKASGLSLMPENFGEVLSTQQLADLIQFLKKP
jgi:putative heme-binding domain-containing protein